MRRGLLARKPTSTSNSPSYTELRLESAEFAEFQLRICAQAEGKTETLRDVLTKLLTLKFGKVSEDVRDRIQRANEADVSRWTERVLSASSVDAVFQD